jgi:hypothetical protein
MSSQGAYFWPIRIRNLWFFGEIPLISQDKLYNLAHRKTCFSIISSLDYMVRNPWHIEPW